MHLYEAINLVSYKEEKMVSKLLLTVFLSATVNAFALVAAAKDKYCPQGATIYTETKCN